MTAKSRKCLSVSGGFMLALVVAAFAVVSFCGCSSESYDDDGGVYTISSAEDLVAFSESVNSGKTYEGQEVNQTCDVDLEGVDFTPIGQFGNDNYFFGIYNGKGHTISNISITTEEYSANNGLFGMLGGTVMNLNLDGYITGNCCGSIASHSAGYYANIVNCHSSVTVLASRSGGIADNFGGYIYGCSYYSDTMALPVVSYNANCVEYSYTNADAIYADTFTGESEKNCCVSDIEEMTKDINSNLAYVALSSNIKLSKLTKFGSSETSGFIDSLTHYPGNTIMAYLEYIIAYFILIVVAADIIAVVAVELWKHHKGRPA